MKTTISTLLFLLSVAAASAADTNIAIRVTVTVVGTSTNQTTINLDSSVAKEKVMVDGGIWDFKRAQASGQTNTLDWYLAKVTIKDKFKEIADAKNRFESSATLGKLTQLLTTDLDLLSASDLSSLSTIAAKAP